jgi:hypothetical protein
MWKDLLKELKKPDRGGPASRLRFALAPSERET